MNEIREKVIKIAKEILNERGNPVLILNLNEINPSNLIKFNELIARKKFNEIDVILQTPGGDIDAAFLFAKLLRSSSNKVNIFVPLYAKSAGTLMCLAADKIIMTSLSELGPLDTQIRENQDGSAPTYNSALNGFKALEQVQLHALETLDIATKMILARSGMKIAEAIQLAASFAGNTSGTLYSQLNPLKIGEYARALEIGEKYGIILLTRYMGWNEEDAELTVKTLVKQYPAHGFVIDVEELLSLGLPAEYNALEFDNILCQLRLLLIKAIQNGYGIMELIEPVIDGKNDNIEKESKMNRESESTKVERRKNKR